MWLKEVIKMEGLCTKLIGKGEGEKMGFPSSSDGKESACNAGDPGSIPGLGRSPWRRKWQSTLVLLPGKSHGQGSLAGCNVWSHKELTGLSN